LGVYGCRFSDLKIIIKPDEVDKYVRIILPPTRKKVTFVFFVVESLSNPGNSMSIAKLSGKIGFKIFPDLEDH